MQHTKPGVADKFIDDVQDISRKLMENPSQKAEGKVSRDSNLLLQLDNQAFIQL